MRLSFLHDGRNKLNNAIQSLIQDCRNLNVPMKFISFMTNEFTEVTEAAKRFSSVLLKPSVAYTEPKFHPQ